MEEKKFLLFDWDGTLLDSTNTGFLKVQENLANLGLPSIPQEKLRQHWGLPADKLFQLLLKELPTNHVTYADFLLAYQNIKEKYPPNKEQLLALKYLKSFDYKIGILTSRSHASWIRSCQRVNFDYTIFDYTQTTCDYANHKPDGRVFVPVINWAQKQGISPHKILYFGDTIYYDLKAAFNSQPPIDFVGVVSGVNTYAEFLATGLPAKKIISSFSQLPLYLYIHSK